tara:strand:+ start:1548 stop:1709 length:162 start_codon:yes stop_codon:yes gene_type:complete
MLWFVQRSSQQQTWRKYTRPFFADCTTSIVSTETKKEKKEEIGKEGLNPLQLM